MRTRRSATPGSVRSGAVPKLLREPKRSKPPLVGNRKLTPPELRAWRAARGLRQSEVAEALGVSPNTVARWEGGSRPAPPLLRLALERIAQRFPVRAAPAAP